LFLEIAGALKSLGPWVLAPAFVYLMMESSIFLGLILPGEIVVVFIGALAGQGIIDFRAALPVVTMGTIAGDNLGYFVGMRYGDVLFGIWPWLRRRYERHVDEIRNYLERWGLLTILAARIAGIAQAFVPFVCGSSGMSYGRFVAMDVLAEAVWAGSLCTIGYMLGRKWQIVSNWLAPIGGGLMGILLLVAGWYAVSRWRDRESHHSP
jgi:undecaprenyl-diphosphatase